jgi:hypothetical protein
LQFVLTKPVFFVTKLGTGPLHKALRVSRLVVVYVSFEGAGLYERLQAAQLSWAVPVFLRNFMENQRVSTKSDFFVLDMVRSLGLHGADLFVENGQIRFVLTGSGFD